MQGTSQFHIYIKYEALERRDGMAGSKASYVVEVHFPEGEEGILEIRKRMGAAYAQFVKDYILTLSISDEEKNELYIKVVEHLLNN